MIDLYVFRHVCEYISGWIEAGKNIKPVSVNISHCTIVRPNFMENLMDIWFDYNIPKDSIVIEVSEDKVKGGLSDVLDKIVELKITVSILRLIITVRNMRTCSCSRKLNSIH